MTAGLSIKARALRCLAQREHSRAELERKLSAALARVRAGRPGVGASGPGGAEEHEGRDEDPSTRELQQVRQALDELTERGLLSDARAAESVLAAQGRRHGSRRVKQVLQAKGLAAELVEATLQQSRATEYARAREVWLRRFGAPADDAAGRARQARFLAGRGFDGEIIRRLVKGLDAD
ncbi:MAG: regulatory protein RecX [Rubrivivax sp.]|nr:regulatory protein RecX [Rubrivivax sp.]